MKIEFYKVPESIVIIRDWYTPEELKLVWAELDVICSSFIMGGSDARSAQRIDGTSVKKGHGLFLDAFYNERRVLSPILNLSRKIYDREFISKLIDYDPVFTYYRLCNFDNTLVNYYEDDDEYKSHTDRSIYTSNLVLWREPQKFNGGKFLLTQKELDFDLKSNDMVIFPGYMLHRVTKLEMHENYTPWKSGRYSVTNFVILRS
jgi:hypothetical protein